LPFFVEASDVMQFGSGNRPPWKQWPPPAALSTVEANRPAETTGDGNSQPPAETEKVNTNYSAISSTGHTNFNLPTRHWELKKKEKFLHHRLHHHHQQQLLKPSVFVNAGE